MNIHDFSVKHGGRGAKFRVLVETDADADSIGRRLARAAGGEQKNALLIASAKVDEPQSLLHDTARPSTEEPRSLLFDIFVNTDEDFKVIAQRLAEAANGPRTRKYAVTIAVLEPDEVKKLMELMAETARSPSVRDLPGWRR